MPARSPAGCWEKHLIRGLRYFFRCCLLFPLLLFFAVHGARAQDSSVPAQSSPAPVLPSAQSPGKQPARADASAGIANSRRIRAARVTEAIKVDGRLDEPPWS